MNLISNPTLHILDKLKHLSIEDKTFLAPAIGLKVNTYKRWVWEDMLSFTEKMF